MIIQGNTVLSIAQASHEYRVLEGAIAIENRTAIKLTAEQEKEFSKGIKIGVLKQLHRKKLLTDEQLNQLIKMQK